MCKKTNGTVWIKEKISRLAYGEKTDFGIRPSTSKANLLKGDKLNVKSLSNKKIINHINSEKTIYYYGNGKTTSEETLVMIDIDVQKKNKLGSTQGAIKFVEHLRKFFPKLYFEPSTNLKGIHAYFILKKLNVSAKIVNKTLKGFDNWLKKEAEKINADIEIVEVKGLCPEINYKDNKISNIKYGTLAKIPRNLEKISTLDNQFLSIKEIEKEYYLDFIKNNNEGSVSNKLFSKDDIKKLNNYKELFNELTNNHKLKARRHIVTDEDFAIAILILLFINKNPNKDNTIPTERVKQLWKSLFKYHDIKRNWNHHRWKTIRDFLSSNNFIDWKDNKYSFGDKTNNKKGIACKWKLSEKFLMYVQNFIFSITSSRERASLMDTVRLIKVNIKENTRFLLPKLRFFRLLDYENMLIKIYSRMESLCSV